MLTGNNGQDVPAGLSLNGTVLTIDPANPVFDSLNYGVGRPLSFDYLISDSHGATVHQVGIVTITGVNDAPTSTDDTLSAVYNAEKVLKIADFGDYNDVDGSGLSAVKITDLPDVGTLFWSSDGTTWNPVTFDQVISRSEIISGHLKYVPEAGETPVTIAFLVSDGAHFSENSYSLIVDVQQPPHYDVDLNINFWGNGEGIDGATSIITDNLTSVETLASGAGNGRYEYDQLLEGAYTLTAQREVAESDRDAIDVDDAVAALDLVIGNGSESSYKYLAADVNRDGSVGFRDVVSILRTALGRGASANTEWVIVPSGTGSEHMDNNNVVWPVAEIPVTLDQDRTLDLVGVLPGDVDGSWTSFVW